MRRGRGWWTSTPPVTARPAAASTAQATAGACCQIPSVASCLSEPIAFRSQLGPGLQCASAPPLRQEAHVMCPRCCCGSDSRVPSQSVLMSKARHSMCITARICASQLVDFFSCGGYPRGNKVSYMMSSAQLTSRVGAEQQEMCLGMQADTADVSSAGCCSRRRSWAAAAAAAAAIVSCWISTLGSWCPCGRASWRPRSSGSGVPARLFRIRSSRRAQRIAGLCAQAVSRLRSTSYAELTSGHFWTVLREECIPPAPGSSEQYATNYSS